MAVQAGDGMTVSVSVERIREHIECLAKTIRHPITCPSGLNAPADYISRELHEAGADVSEHEFQVPGVGGRFRNVEGVINAGSEPKEWLISAHYDTVRDSPGADDNASGVGVTLEAARVLAQHDTKQPGAGQPR